MARMVQGFQYAIALVSCTRDVSQTIQRQMISRKGKKKSGKDGLALQ